MKKITLLSLALFVGMISFAQQHQAKFPVNLEKQSVLAKYITVKDTNNPIAVKQGNPYVASKSIFGSTIGNTYYDLQTNKSVYNRIVKHADGTISAIWTFSGTSNSNFNDRGTGYNYYNNTSWLPKPMLRLESTRTGFPSLTVADGKEIIIAHNLSNNLIMSTRTVGTGTWTETTIPHSANHTLTWARAMGGGLTSQKIHLIATDNTGDTVHSMLYSRSSDGGSTWDIQDSILPGVNPVTEMLPSGADSYCMDVKGDTVGIVVGGMTSDVVLIKSLDGGTTWTKQIVYQHPIPLWNTSLTGVPEGTSDANADGIADTLVVTDGRYALVISNDGVFHIFMGITRIKKDSAAPANSFNFWPFTDGVVYWNNNMSVIVPAISFYADTLLNKVGYMIDVNSNGYLDFNVVPPGDFPFGDFSFTSLSSMPSAAVGDDGTIYCTYSSLVEGTDYGDGRGYRNIYAVKSTDNGTTWSYPVNITQDEWSECLFGSLARNVDSCLDIVFQRSYEPGIALQPDAGNPHVIQDNDIIYVKTSKNLVEGINPIAANTFSVSQNYPNPFASTTVVDVNLKKSSALSLEVVNMLGQKMMELNKGNVAAGTHTFTIDRSNLNSGIYFYTVKVGENAVTKKMIVE